MERSHSMHAVIVSRLPGVGQSLDDDNGPILTLRTVYAVPGIARIASLPPVTRIDAPVGSPRHRAREQRARLPHGPPRALVSPRAPPLFA